LQQAHLAANELTDKIEERHGQTFNVVPLIQQCTVGLIFRYITHQADIPQSVKEAVVTTETTTTPNDNNNKNKSSSNSLSSATSSSSSLLHHYLQAVTDIRMIILAQSRSIWFLLPRWIYEAWAALYRQEETAMRPIRKFAYLACRLAKPGSPLYQLRDGESHLRGKRIRMDMEEHRNKQLDNRSENNNNNNNNNSNNETPRDKDISQDLLEEAITLLFAGQDTSAATLSWTLHLLSLYPNIQTKLATEVRAVLGDYDTSEQPPPQQQQQPQPPQVMVTKAMIGRMPYLDAVIKESMRLYPVAPFVVRKLTEDIVIPLDEEEEDANDGKNKHSDKENAKVIRLPANAMACLWIYGLHHHPDFWDQPEEFLPERWLVSNSDNKDNNNSNNSDNNSENEPPQPSQEKKKKDPGISNGAYMPFAVGPRNCLGQPLAHWILRALLARLVQRYDFQDARVLAASSGTSSSRSSTSSSGTKDIPSVVDPSQWRQDMQAGFTVLPRGGVHVVASAAVPSKRSSAIPIDDGETRGQLHC